MSAKSVSPHKYSLKWRLVLSITVGFILIWAAAFAWLYFSLERKMTQTLDERLSASAHMVGRLLSQIPATQLSNAVQPAVSELNQHNLIACEVSLSSSDLVLSSTIVARTKGAPSALSSRVEGFSTWTDNGIVWRSYTLKREPLQVVTAEKMQLRNELLAEILKSILLPLLLTLLFCVALVWWVIKKEFTPIEQTTQLLKLHKDQPERELDYIHQLDHSQIPLELQSFIEHIADLVLRLQRSLENEKNFSAFAAHELRSPLTAIKLNVQLSQMMAQQTLDAGTGAIPQAVMACLDEAERSIHRYQQLLEQLLLLSKTDHQLDTTADHAQLPLAQISVVIEQVIAQLKPLYPQIDQMLVVNWDSLSSLQLPEHTLQMVLLNIIENSLKHAQSQKPIQVWQQQAALIIEDFGVGMQAQDLGLAKQRFWRKSAQSQGYGLGLALSESLLAKNGYQLQLALKDTAGLMVKILPMRK